MSKTVLITGASSGVGKATAKYFSKQGWNVIATMRQPEKEGELNRFDNMHLTKLDVRSMETIEGAIHSGLERFGKIDAVVNSAAYGQYGLFEAISAEQIRAEFETNVFGVMNVIRAILPYFRTQKQGMILNISSAGGRVAVPKISIYIASKFAIEGFSESVYYELASQNITIKLIEPGGIDTPFGKTALENIAIDPELISYSDFVKQADESMAYLYTLISQPEDVAKVVFEAATDGKNELRYVTGNDAKSWIKARTSLDDPQYMEYIKGAWRI